MARPRLVTFVGKNMAKWSYIQVDYRAPKKGEWYLSGAIPEAYQAPNDLTQCYYIVEPLVEHRPKTVWVPVKKGG
jgi:hypothetical protein